MGKYTNIAIIGAVAAGIAALAVFRKPITAGFQTAGATIGESIGGVFGQAARSTVETFQALLPKFPTTDSGTGIIIPPPIIDPAVGIPSPNTPPAGSTPPKDNGKGGTSGGGTSGGGGAGDKPPYQDPFAGIADFNRQIQKAFEEAARGIQAIIPPITIPPILGRPFVPAFAESYVPDVQVITQSNLVSSKLEQAFRQSTKSAAPFQTKTILPSGKTSYFVGLSG